jgi:hypothetical protein
MGFLACGTFRKMNRLLLFSTQSYFPGSIFQHIKNYLKFWCEINFTKYKCSGYFFYRLSYKFRF